ncbi:hypothetical protein ES703_103030 [subsurface metagenome]
MKRYDIVTAGHVSHDILDYRGKVSRFIGGAVYFSAFAAKRSGASLLVVTKMAESDFRLLEGMEQEGIEILALPSTRTTSIENTFLTDDVDDRIVKLLAQADPFSLADIPEVEARVYNLAGLFKGEIPPSLIEPLAIRGKVALDLQVMLRTSSQGRFHWKDWEEKAEYLPYLTYIKADSLESKVITGTDDRRKGAEILHDLGAKEVMITHSSEVILFDGKRHYSAPFNPENLSGRAGRGDTCFMSYITRRLTHDHEESLRYAAALTSIKMESPGPFTGTQEQVLERMKTL